VKGNPRTTGEPCGDRTYGGATTAASSTVYIAGVYERTDTGAVTKYYTAFGRTLALAQTPAGGGAATVSYPLLDHLGSTSALTDAGGAVAGTRAYWPYGAARSATGVLAAPPQTDRLYTGQREEAGDPALGLYNYRARFYSTTLGRFVSVDPVVGDVYDPQAWNAYSYVGNNPLVRTDPTGERWCNSDDCDARSSAPMNHYESSSPRAGNTCDLACQMIAAWNAFHPGGCWSCGGSFLAGDIAVPAPLPVPVPVPIPWPHVSGYDVDRALKNFKDNWTTWGQALGGYLFSERDQSAGIGPHGRPAEPVPAEPLIEETAERIAAGHAGSKHVDDFPDVPDAEALARHIGDIIRNPTAVKTGARGRIAYWDERSGTIIITDPSSPDGGTAFRPNAGK